MTAIGIHRAHATATQSTWACSTGALATGGLLLPLLLAPLPLGAVFEPARSLLAIGALLAAAFAFWRVLTRRSSLMLPAGTLPLLLLVGLALLQLLPVAGAPSPAAAALLHDHRPTTLTVLPHRTLWRALELCALVATFVAASQLLARTARARCASGALLTLGSGIAIYGFLMQHGVLPPVEPGQTRSVLVGTYWNRNHLAGLLVMAVLVGLGAVASRARQPRTSAGQVLLLAGIGCCTAALFGTQSRGGLLALATGGIVFCCLAPGWRKPITFAALFAVAAIGWWFAPEALLGRLQQVDGDLHNDAGRPGIWRGAIALWRAFPWLGTGLGTYGDMSPATQPPGIGGRLEHAHNDPLELLVETGLCGALLALISAIAFVRTACQRGTSHEHRDHERQALAAGGFAATAAIAVHGLFDFNLQIPANAAWFACLAGMAAGLRRATGFEVRGRVLAIATAFVAVVAFAFGARVARHADLDPSATLAAGELALPAAPQTAAALANAVLSRNALSPGGHQLLGEAQLRQGDPAAAASFARSLHWRNADDRPWYRFDIAMRCLLAGDLVLAGTMLCELLAAEPTLVDAVVGKLYSAVPAGELLRELLRAAPTRARQSLSEQLLRAGDFTNRELELAALRGRATPAVLTLQDDVLLQRCEVQQARDGGDLAIAVRLDFELGGGAQPTACSLHCDGPGAAVHRPFRPSAEPFLHTFRLDPTWPPGDYTIALAFRPDAPRCTLSSFRIETTPLTLPLDARQPAEQQLHLVLANGAPRSRPRQGLVLPAGGEAFRDLALPDAATMLELRCSGSGRLQVSFGGGALVCNSAATAQVQRFALPATRTGRLSIRNEGPTSDITLVEFWCSGRRSP